METLLKSTAAYKILSGDRRCGKLSHAYMLQFGDVRNLKNALMLFALEFFGVGGDSDLGRRILHGSYPDVKIYPREEKKFTVDGISELIEDCALRPVEGDKKLYILCGFDSASQLLQNKLLKTLEEPESGIHFLLGVTSAAPVLDTVKSRVKILEIPPFSESRIYEALERRGHREVNARAAASANGILGAAENIAEGGWFTEVAEAAEKICAAAGVADAGILSAKYGDIKYKEELLSEMQRIYFLALTENRGSAKNLAASVKVMALENINNASADLKCNANFSSLLYDFILRIAEVERKAEEIEGKKNG